MQRDRTDGARPAHPLVVLDTHERDVLWRELASFLPTALGDARLDVFSPAENLRVRDRVEEMFALLDDIGWADTEPRRSFPVRRVSCRWLRDFLADERRGALEQVEEARHWQLDGDPDGTAAADVEEGLEVFSVVDAVLRRVGDGDTPMVAGIAF